MPERKRTAARKPAAAGTTAKKTAATKTATAKASTAAKSTAPLAAPKVAAPPPAEPQATGEVCPRCGTSKFGPEQRIRAEGSRTVRYAILVCERGHTFAHPIRR